MKKLSTKQKKIARVAKPRNRITGADFKKLKKKKERISMAKRRGLYANINARRRKGISRPKSKSTITPKAYANMKAGFPKKRKRK